MGATTNIKELFFSNDLTERNCYECDKAFNLDDWKNDNWTLEYRNNTNIDWNAFKPRTSRGKITLEISLYHIDCPEDKEEERKPRLDRTVGNLDLK